MPRPEPQEVVRRSVVDLHAQVRRGHLRWLCLFHLDVVRPETMTELALLEIIREAYPDAQIRELRRQLDYLAMQNLLALTERNGVWHLKLTHQGVDIVEFTVPCPPGINRPQNQ